MRILKIMSFGCVKDRLIGSLEEEQKTAHGIKMESAREETLCKETRDAMFAGKE